MVIARSLLSNSINQIDAERLDLSQQLAQPQTRPTELLGDMVVTAKPVKKTLVIALAAMLGLLGGAMLTLFAEFLAKAKTSRKLA